MLSSFKRDIIIKRPGDEMVDMQRSERCSRKGMKVQVLSRALMLQ